MVASATQSITPSTGRRRLPLSPRLSSTMVSPQPRSPALRHDAVRDPRAHRQVTPHPPGRNIEERGIQAFSALPRNLPVSDGPMLMKLLGIVILWWGHAFREPCRMIPSSLGETPRVHHEERSVGRSWSGPMPGEELDHHLGDDVVGTGSVRLVRWWGRRAAHGGHDTGPRRAMLRAVLARARERGDLRRSRPPR